MDEITVKPTKVFMSSSNKIYLIVIIISLVLGISTGYILASSGNSSSKLVSSNSSSADQPKTASNDTSTFKDFAEGTIQKRPAAKNPNDYVEGTHILVRPGQPDTALTSSVLDLSQYEGKKVKVYGETQKALKSAWLMDVGKVEVE